MNILFISHGLYPCDHGGMEIFNYYFVDKLIKDHNVTVLTNCRVYDNPKIKVIRASARLFGIRRFGFGKLSNIIQDTIHIMRLRKSDPLIFVSYTGNSGFLGIHIPILKRILNLKYIIINHGGGLKAWKNKYINEVLFKHAVRIVAVSDPIKEEYINRTGRKIITIPPLIPLKRSEKNRDDIRIKFGFHKDDKIVFLVGSLKKLKCPDVVLRAFIKLKADFIRKHNLKLVFVGAGSLKKELATITSAHRFNRYVSFLGNINYRFIPDVYKMGDIYIIASLFEGTPLSLLEAMFNQKVIIGSDVRGINSIIKHGVNGLLFQPNDIGQLYKRIKMVADNFDRVNYLSKNALLTYEAKFCCNKMLKQYNQLIKDI